jgi:hypothetical protein
MHTRDRSRATTTRVRGWVAVGSAALAVAGIVMLVQTLPGAHNAALAPASGGSDEAQEPELGRSPQPQVVLDRLASFQRDGEGQPPRRPDADVLAHASTAAGDLFTVGQVRTSGTICTSDYISTRPTAASVRCGEVRDFARYPLAVTRANVPGETAFMSGQAPKGTARVEISSAEGLSLSVPATRGGGRWSNSCFFIVALPTEQGVTVRALDAQGRELARTEAPAVPN